MNYPQPPSVQDVLGGSSLPTASFKNAPNGAFYEGRVVKEEIAQQTKMDNDRTPEFWDPPVNSRPKWQVIVHIQNPAYVTQENPEGILRAFMKSGMLTAGQKTLKDLGLKEFLGGYIRITQTGSTPTQNGFDQKTYQVDFAPGATPVQQVLGANPQTGEVPPVQEPQWAAQAPQGTPPGMFQAPPAQQAPVFPSTQQAFQGATFPPAPQAPQQSLTPQFQAPPQAAPAPQTPQFQAPPQAPAGAEVMQQFGFTEIGGAPQAPAQQVAQAPTQVPPIDPQVRAYVEQLLASGATPEYIAEQMTGHGFPVTVDQVLVVKHGELPV